MKPLRHILVAIALSLATLLNGRPAVGAEALIQAAAAANPLDLKRSPEQRKIIESLQKDFPRLGRNYEVRGAATSTYNCIAWSINEKEHWVWPGSSMQDFDRLFAEKGYKRVKGMDFGRKNGVEKI